MARVEDNQRQDEWIVTLGFPCQDISIAGRGEGITGTRSGLWFEAFEIIRVLRPKFAIIENVGAITFRGLWRILSDLASIGYDASWQDIRASDMGAPHRRERIWIIAYAQGHRRKRSICSDIENSKNTCWPELQSSGSLDTRLFIFEEFEKRVGQPAVFGMAHGVSHRVERLKAFGNSIVSQIAELLFRKIKELIND